MEAKHGVGRVVHSQREAYDVYIGRPGPWGNPFSHKSGTLARFAVGSRDEAVEAYKAWLWVEITEGRITLESLAELAGKTLGCWCSPLRCHGDVLAAAAAWAAKELSSRGA